MLRLPVVGLVLVLPLLCAGEPAQAQAPQGAPKVPTSSRPTEMRQERHFVGAVARPARIGATVLLEDRESGALVPFRLEPRTRFEEGLPNDRALLPGRQVHITFVRSEGVNLAVRVVPAEGAATGGAGDAAVVPPHSTTPPTRPPTAPTEREGTGGSGMPEDVPGTRGPEGSPGADEPVRPGAPPLPMPAEVPAGQGAPGDVIPDGRGR